jgi:hypothetical protein
VTKRQILKIARAKLTDEEFNACLTVAYEQLAAFDRAVINMAAENLQPMRNMGEITSREVTALVGVALL